MGVGPGPKIPQTPGTGPLRLGERRPLDATTVRQHSSMHYCRVFGAVFAGIRRPGPRSLTICGGPAEMSVLALAKEDGSESQTHIENVVRKSVAGMEVLQP